MAQTDPSMPPPPATASRRAFIAGGTASAALMSIGARGSTPLPPGLFSLGVASGDPEPASVILWTRLAPQPLAPDGGLPGVAVPVRWEVSDDEGFARIARDGTALADPRWGHSVHVDVQGLRPDRSYFYRFIAGGEVSMAGRTRTTPAAGAPVDRLRLCFASCQKYEAGFYAAWRHMVAEDPHLILFLGDYIYEGAPGSKDAVRLHRNPEPFDLAGYRARYATYKLDPLLQAAHQAAPWALTWDDHEVANDYAAALGEDNEDPAVFLRRRAAAYQAYYEHQPLRAKPPRGPDMTLYRTLDWGALAQLQIIDDRQYRGARACQPPELVAAHKRYLDKVPLQCDDLFDPSRTMLGKAQEHWLDERLARSQATWNILAQQTLMHQSAEPNEAGEMRYSADNWSGYPAARDRIFRRWVEAGTRNPLALGGDIHAFAAADIRDPDKPDRAPIGAEFVGGSITSTRPGSQFKRLGAQNGLSFAEDQVRGYGRLDIDRNGGTVTFRGLADARREDSTIADIARFSLEAGRPGLHTESL
ncbi:alkaline phosphatase D family protein [Novosphingobium sp. Leaf2]|uniref:alkaline phosphatase D family protein n=1 Tax=Novosphingobium sp. Leaf2 TaxID=1735670 RepID=UPI0006F4DE64|nr:alkaline phosphatase D family protein [Novosphingobium sp. Leaf2]KQM19615.1 alkaline phosphatase [Novosphingobium sp. Leaf2]